MAGGMHPAFTPLPVTTQGNGHSRSPYTGRQDRHIKLALTPLERQVSWDRLPPSPRSPQPPAARGPAPRPGNVFPQPSQGKQVGSGPAPLQAIKKQRVRAGRKGRAQLKSLLGSKSYDGDKEGSPRETPLPHSPIPLVPSLFSSHLK